MQHDIVPIVKNVQSDRKIGVHISAAPSLFVQGSVENDWILTSTPFLSLWIPFISLRPLVYQVPSVPTPPSHASSTASIRLLCLMTETLPYIPYNTA